MTIRTNNGANPMMAGAVAPGTRALLKSATAGMLTAAVMTASPQTWAKPSDYECQINRQVAASAANDAMRAQREEENAARHLVIEGTCEATMWAMGASEKTISLMCRLASEGADAAGPSAASTEAARKAYRDALNPECYPDQN